LIMGPKARLVLIFWREVLVMITVVQNREFDLVELNDEDLDLVSAGQIVIPGGTRVGVATGVGGNVEVSPTGTIIARAGTGGFALGLVTGGPITLPF